MDIQKYAQQILNDLLLLPENKIIEVADFVRFLKSQVQHKGIPISKSGLTQEQAFNLRARLASFDNDWNAPGMEVYDEL
ncbi:MAG TPA: hypothetical protein PL110_20310 [Candidatus Eremiobacteraeota bacterium]|nr:MAG: hypothetical protein BWY64_03617 [bacterium ADurb.Bin363]HPZ10445.1 hypothetical protein [Candidatus Eremiobacteraeota bacterium]